MTPVGAGVDCEFPIALDGRNVEKKTAVYGLLGWVSELETGAKLGG